MLKQQMEREKAGTASRSDTTGSFGHAIRTAAGGEPPHGKNELVGQHPAMQVPDVTNENANDEKQVSAQAAEELQENVQPADVGNAEGNESQPQVQANDTEQDKVDGPEVLRSDYDAAEREHKGRLAAITEHLNAATLHEQGTAVDDDSLDDFRPHILHSAHSPVPMALVNRVPRGSECLELKYYPR